MSSLTSNIAGRCVIQLLWHTAVEGSDNRRIGKWQDRHVVFVCKCPVRWSDVDSYGHVNNVQQLKLLEEARVALFFEAATHSGITTFNGDLVVVRHEIDYRRPLLYRAKPFTVELWVTELKASKVSIAYVIRDDEQVYSEAASTLAAYDAKTERPRRLSPAERDWLRHYTAETPPR